jgi:type II secretory pathway pseudopilin PulG
VNRARDPGWRAPRTRAAGFAYIGLLLFVAVFGALSAGVIGAGANIGQRSAEEELLWVGTQYRNAIRSYYEAGAGGRRYAMNLNELLRDPRIPGVRRHIRRLYPDPLTGSEEWGIVQAPGGGIMGVYSKSEREPLKVEGFATEFADFTGKKKYSEWVFAYVPPGQVAPGASIGARPTGALPAAGSPSTGLPPPAQPALGGSTAPPGVAFPGMVPAAPTK